MQDTYQSIPRQVRAYQMTRQNRVNEAAWPDWLKGLVEDGRIVRSAGEASDGMDRLAVRYAKPAGDGFQYDDIEWDSWIIEHDGNLSEILPNEAFAATYTRRVTRKRKAKNAEVAQSEPGNESATIQQALAA